MQNLQIQRTNSTWASNNLVLEPSNTTVICCRPFSFPFLTLHHKKRHGPAGSMHVQGLAEASSQCLLEKGDECTKARHALLCINITTVVYLSPVLQMLLQTNLTGQHWQHLEKTLVSKGSADGGKERTQKTPFMSQEVNPTMPAVAYPSSRFWIYLVPLYTDAFLFRPVTGQDSCTNIFCQKAKCYVPRGTCAWMMPKQNTGAKLMTKPACQTWPPVSKYQFESQRMTVSCELRGVT